jgi:hypothetical protein
MVDTDEQTAEHSIASVLRAAALASSAGSERAFSRLIIAPTDCFVKSALRERREQESGEFLDSQP